MQGTHSIQQMPPSALPQASLIGRLIFTKLFLDLLIVAGSAPLAKTALVTNSIPSKDPHVPKKAKAAKKGASAALKSDGHASDADSDADSSGDELTIEDEEPEMTPAVLTVSAPTDERGKAIHDAVSAVWSPRNKPALAETIRSGIAGFGDTIRSLRDAWKLKNDNLRKAELPDSPTASEANKLKEEAARYRSSMEVVMSRSLTFGHPAVVKRYVHSPILTSFPESKNICPKIELHSSIDVTCPIQPLHLSQDRSIGGIQNVVMSSGNDIPVHYHNEHTHSCMSIDLEQYPKACHFARDPKSPYQSFN